MTGQGKGSEERERETKGEIEQTIFEEGTGGR
jgi:hypothetical protein